MTVLLATVAVVRILVKVRLGVHGLGASGLIVSPDDEEVIVVLKVAAVMRLLLNFFVKPVVGFLVVAAGVVALVAATRVTVVMSTSAVHHHLFQARWEEKVEGGAEHEEQGNNLEADGALAELHAPLGQVGLFDG